MTKDYTKTNLDYAVFLPSISGFYQKYISDEINGKGMDPARVPAGFDKGVIGCNFLEKDAYFSYKWGLYSAGHAQLDTAKSDVEESMIQSRDRDNTFILGDSGGFQVAKGIIKFDWENFYETPNQPNYVGKADKQRQSLQNWLEHTADYSMILDVPTWAARPPADRRTGLRTFKECLDATKFNNDWFVRNRQGKTKYLNVLQGSNQAEADIWYEEVKNFPFEGWAMGDANMGNMRMLLTRLIKLRDDKLLEQGERDLIHVLGTGKLEWAVMLTALKREIRRSINPSFEMTFDCASPFLATAYGQVYTQHVHRPDRFSYIMDKAVDDKRLAGSKLPFSWNSPIGERLLMGDLCWYAPGMLNKLGKEGRTSWDSFSYFLMMAHNVSQHIDSVQRANELADVAYVTHDVDIRDWRKPAKSNSKALEIDTWVPRNLIYFETFIKELFASETPMQLINENTAFLGDLSRGSVRKSSNTVFVNLFEDDETVDDAGSEHEFDEEDALEKLLHVDEE